MYLCVMCVAPAVAFATGGATLSALTGLPYLLCTFVIGVFIFIVAIFGTDLVRKVASVLSVCIIAGLLIVYIPNIAAGFGAIKETAAAMQAEPVPFGKALYSAFLYGTFQLANVAVFVQHAKSFEKPDDAVKSMGIGFVVNTLMMTMVVLGIMTVCQNPEMKNPERSDFIYGSEWCRKGIYDTADLGPYYSRGSLHGSQYGGCDGEENLQRNRSRMC